MKSVVRRLRRLESRKKNQRTEFWIDLGDGRFRRGNEIKPATSLNDPNVSYMSMIEEELEV
jgi:hypothetical protein